MLREQSVKVIEENGVPVGCIIQTKDGLKIYGLTEKTYGTIDELFSAPIISSPNEK